MSTGRAHHPTLRTRFVPWGPSASVRTNLSRLLAGLFRAVATAATAALVALTLAIPIARAADCCSGPERFWRPCVVTKTTPNSIVVRFAGDDSTRTLALTSMPLQNAAASLNQSKAALVAVGDVQGTQTLLALGVRVRWELRLGVLLGVVGALLGLATLLVPGGPRSLALGEDGPYSASTWQMLIWFGVLVIAYGATLVLRWWAGGIGYAGGVGIPAKLLILSGLSALTFASARTIRQVKENRAAVPGPGPRPRPRFPADLIRDGSGPPDLGRFQMVVVTMLAVVVYVIRVFACLGQIDLSCTTSLPDVDTAILGGVGISQGAYLARKAVAPLERG